MQWLLDPQIWLGLVTLSALEIVLGIDNLVFLAILTERLPESQRAKAARLGLGLALIGRLALLGGAVWIVGMAEPAFAIFGHAASWRDVILVGGGIFLLAKGTHEIHGALEGEEDDDADHGRNTRGRQAALGAIVAQMVLLDLVFSLDSVITAVGMVSQPMVMAAAVVVAMALMVAAAGPLSAFVAKHPTVRMLALAFLLMIGMSLTAEGLGVHVPKGYLYFAMGFSVAVEALNLIARRRRRPVQLRHPLP
ncbi:MAG: TerC family protein [Magnetospirillum sp.]|nr:TerC family protein [Magnetospirillum sp.]